MENKHAYLIMAHNEFEILEKLILLLDDVRNDIYIHIDAKVENFNYEYYKNLIKKSNIYFIKRKKIYWGHFSLIKCEIELIKEAIKREYNYYHLISGVDLPLKTQDEIHRFFEENNGKEFIHFCTEEEANNIKDRVLHYNFIRYYKNNALIGYVCRKFHDYINAIQYKSNFKRRWDNDIKICYGSNWFSITNDLADYIIKKEKWINKKFRFTSCADEVFLQTLVYNSKFKEKLFMSNFNGDYKACLREIDFIRGNPYVYKSDDLNILSNSECIFARKFSSKIDNDIINEVFDYINR